MAGPKVQELSTPALRVRNLTKNYAGRTVLDGVNFDVSAGELVAFLGANGSGKSTTLKCVMGLTEPNGGTVSLDGTSLAGLSSGQRAQARQHAAMVFQKIHLVPRRSALDNVCAGALTRIPTFRSLVPGLFPRHIREEAMACLDRVGLADRALEKVSKLSGGQQQGVAVARALCQRATLVLADEPVSALDPHAAEQVMTLLHDLAQTDRLAVAAVLHQPDLARRHADRAIGLLKGQLVFNSAMPDLSTDQLDALYRPDRIDAS